MSDNEQEQEEQMEDDVSTALAEAIEKHSEPDDDDDPNDEGASEEEGNDEKDEEEEEDGKPSGEDEDEEDEDEDTSESDSGDDEEDEDEGASDGPGDDDDDRDTGRAPASWSPKIREQWGKLPKEVKQQVLKREREVTEALGRSTNARRFADEWSSMLRPYEPLMAAERATPQQAVKQLLNIGAGLITGNPQQKAQIISGLVKQYRVDVEALDSALAGQDSGYDPRIEQMIEQRLRPVNDFLSHQQQQRQQEIQKQQQEVVTEIDKFKESKEAEFFEDVQLDMADILEMADKRGRSLSIKEAYEQACKMNPEIKEILDQRAKAAAARNGKEVVNKKKRAAKSIRGKKGGLDKTSNAGDTDDIEASVTAAWEKHESRGRRRV